MFRIRQHSSTVVKYVDKVLTKPITYIVNLSITNGIVCNQLKSAWVSAETIISDAFSYSENV